MIPSRDKSDAPIAFGHWANLITNGTNMTIKTVMFDNVLELVAGKMIISFVANLQRLGSSSPCLRHEPEPVGVRLTSIIPELDPCDLVCL